MKRIFCFLLIMAVKLLASESAMVLPELVNPAAMAMHKNMVFISEQAHLYVYDLQQKRLVRKMGHEGDGPQEFRIQTNINNGGLFLSIQEGKLLANSLGKVTLFSLEGRYEREMKTFSRGHQFMMTSNGFLGAAVIQEKDGTEYYTINLYNTAFKNPKELHRQVIWNERTCLDPIRFCQHPLFIRQENRIFIGNTEADGEILVFDDTGRPITIIRFPFPRKKVSAAQINRFNQHFNSHPGYLGFLDQFKSVIHYSDTFPAIRHLHVEGQMLYVLTFQEDSRERCWYVFDLKGAFLGKALVDSPEISPLRLTPFSTQNGFFYVLMNNEQDEHWSLHPTRIMLH